MQRFIVFPVVSRRIHNHRLQRRTSIVPRQERSFSGIGLGFNDRVSVRVNEDLLSIEPLAMFGEMGAPDAVPIELTVPCPNDMDMPVVAGAVTSRIELKSVGRPRVVLVVEEQKFDPSGESRIETKIHPSWCHSRTEWVRQSTLNFQRSFHLFS